MQPYAPYGPEQPYQTPWQPGPWQGPAPWPPYGYNPPRYRPSAPLATGIVLVLVGFILAIIALPTAWWSVSISASSSGSSMSGRIDFNSGTMCAMMTGYGSGCVNYPPGYQAIADVLTGSFVLALLGLIFAILAFVFLILGIFRQWSKYLALVTGVIASVSLVGAAVYAFALVPGAFNGIASLAPGEGVTGFFGHTTYSHGGVYEDLTYGGGLAWYMSIASFVLVLIGTVIGFLGVRPTPQLQVMMPYYPPQLPSEYYGAPSAPAIPESPAPPAAPAEDSAAAGPPPGEGAG